MEMYNKNQPSILVKDTTLVFWGTKSLIFQVILVGAAVILPSVAHLSGAPVRILLPMHWPVILAGLVFGWRSGALVGLLSPTLSYLVSGMPLPAILPAMTVELIAYGLVTGLLREKLRLNPFVSVTVALITGRILFAMTVYLGFAASGNYMQYFRVALLPGIFAAIGQIIFLPIIANRWVKREQENFKN
jgi:LytS/YehU family sensor histidine kinase